nr:UPF0545 protein C22orf39 homolog isoform X1 [Anser cygnoides]
MAGGESWRPPRPCEDYWWEWRHCRGLRHAFHHYYAHGQLPACARWRDDYTACRAWESGRAAAAQLCARAKEPEWRKSRNTPRCGRSGRARRLNGTFRSTKTMPSDATALLCLDLISATQQETLKLAAPLPQQARCCALLEEGIVGTSGPARWENKNKLGLLPASSGHSHWHSKGTTQIQYCGA